MIIIIIILILLFLIFFNRPTDGQVVLIFANIGAGKTTLLARYAQRELKKIKKGKSKFETIISNTPISGCLYVPNIRSLLQVSAPEKTLFLIDEAGIVWNNRKMKISDKEIEYIKLIRHYDSKMVCISQSYDDVDITIRRIYTSMYLLNKIGFLTIIRPIRKYVTIDSETEQIIDGYKFKTIFSYGYLFRPLYYKYFDTKHKVNDGRVHPTFEAYSVIPYPKKKSILDKFNKKKVDIV